VRRQTRPGRAARTGKGFRKDFGPWREHVAKLRTQHPLDYNHDAEAIQQEKC